MREIGKSSYTIKKMVNLAIDSIISHSNKPLRLCIKFGILVSFMSSTYGIWLIARYFIHAVPIVGWTSIMVVIFFIFGILLGVLGILGLYIGKIFDETKGRPLYITQETINILND